MPTTDLSAFRDHILKKVQLTDAELERFVSFFTPVRVKKRQFVVQPNFVARKAWASFPTFIGEAGELCRLSKMF